jgi:hypothetical protein
VARPLEEQVRFFIRAIGQETQVQVVRIGRKMAMPRRGHVQTEGLRALIQEEERNVLDREGADQPVGDRMQHRVQVGLRPKLTREFNQGAPVIVLIFVEEIAVEQILDPTANRLEHEGRDHNQRNYRGTAEVLRPGEAKDEPVEAAYNS